MKRLTPTIAAFDAEFDPLVDRTNYQNASSMKPTHSASMIAVAFRRRSLLAPDRGVIPDGRFRTTNTNTGRC
jgi:hypothetical protein